MDSVFCRVFTGSTQAVGARNSMHPPGCRDVWSCLAFMSWGGVRAITENDSPEPKTPQPGLQIQPQMLENCMNAMRALSFYNAGMVVYHRGECCPAQR